MSTADSAPDINWVEHDEEQKDEISSSGINDENVIIQDFMKNYDDKYLFENEDITKSSVECISTYPVEISNCNSDVLFIGNENIFDTKSISILINANDDYVFENKESIEDLLNFCDPPFSPTLVTIFNHHENQKNIVVSPTTYWLNSVDNTYYDIVANDLNALNNIPQSAAIYTNHDSNYYPTKNTETSHGEQNRTVRKNFTGSENEENSKKSSLNKSSGIVNGVL